jgi:hypothetical protein
MYMGQMVTSAICRRQPFQWWCPLALILGGEETVHLTLLDLNGPPDFGLSTVDMRYQSVIDS